MLRFIVKLLIVGFLLLVIPSCANQKSQVMLDGQIASLAWSPNGQFLAIVPADGAIHVWDSLGNGFVQTLSSQPHTTSMSWSPDGSRIASAARNDVDSTIDLWDIHSGQLTRSRSLPISGTRSLDWAPHGSTISVGIVDTGILLWNVDTDEDRTLTGQFNNILNIAWSPDGNFLAAGLQDGSIYVWDAREDELLHTFSYSLDHYIADLTWSPDGQTLASASCFTEENCTLVFWNPASGKYTRALQANVYEITNIAWSPNGRFIALALTSGDVVLYSPSAGERVRTLQTPSGSTVIAWSPDGKRLAAGSEDGSVLVWNLH